MQLCCVRQHSHCTVHRVAQEFFLAPDKPLEECLPYGLKEQDLFRGNVPQPEDWLRAWRACRTPSSFRAAMAFFGTVDYTQGRQRPGFQWHGAFAFTPSLCAGSS